MLNLQENKNFPNILVKKDAVSSLEDDILEYRNLDEVLFVSDEKILRNAGQFLPKHFLERVKNKLIFKKPYADDKYVSLIEKECDSISLIVGFGSGTINDLCKITAHNLGIDYIIIASAASMNGYLSKNASISVSGHKKTLPATCPKLVICDLNILESAPKKLTKAGIGDSLCFYSCWFDWYLSHKLLATKFDENLFLIQKEKVDYFINNYAKFNLEDEKLLQVIIEMLLISGWSMTLAGGSYPASQSEHLISHVLEMKYGNKLQNSLHGLQIALTTLVSLKLQKKILKLDEISLQEKHFPKNEMIEFFGEKVAKECQLEFDKKSCLINKNLGKNLDSFKSELKKIYLDEAVLRKIFRHFNIKPYPSNFAINQKEFANCIKYAPFIRDRFTCLDLLNVI
ncbi:MAG: iron-containing alcohol dehydrogenase [Rickettsiales bacterium]|nr:iron-containing alcohol dehydrogenase [Rickettsiales bacterium]